VHRGGGPRGRHVAAHAGVAWSARAYARHRREEDEQVGMERAAEHGILRKVPLLETHAQTEPWIHRVATLFLACLTGLFCSYLPFQTQRFELKVFKYVYILGET